MRLTANEMDQLVKRIDTNHNGIIEFNEWFDFLLLMPDPDNIRKVYQYYQKFGELYVLPDKADETWKYLAIGGFAGAVQCPMLPS